MMRQLQDPMRQTPSQSSRFRHAHIAHIMRAHCALFLLCLTIYGEAMSEHDRVSLRERARAMFYHG